MDIVVTEKNVHQVVQAMYENVKSNQHRLDEMEPVITKMANRVERLAILLLDNGYAKAVESNAENLEGFREEFQGFLLVREETCPTAKRAKDESIKSREIKTWKVALIRLGVAILALIPTVLLIIERTGG